MLRKHLHQAQEWAIPAKKSGKMQRGDGKGALDYKKEVYKGGKEPGRNRETLSLHAALDFVAEKFRLCLSFHHGLIIFHSYLCWHCSDKQY